MDFTQPRYNSISNMASVVWVNHTIRVVIILILKLQQLNTDEAYQKKNFPSYRSCLKFILSTKVTGLGASRSTFLLAQQEFSLVLGKWTSVSVERCNW